MEYHRGVQITEETDVHGTMIVTGGDFMIKDRVKVTVFGNLIVDSDVLVFPGSNLIVHGNVTIGGDLIVYNNNYVVYGEINLREIVDISCVIEEFREKPREEKPQEGGLFSIIMTALAACV